MYVSPNIVPGIPVHFAIDNCDFKNDTLDGKTNSILQHKLSFKSLTIVVCNITYQSIEGPKSLKVTPSAPRKFQNRQFSNFDGGISCIEQNDYSDLDRTWALCQVMDEDISGVLPTWPAFNSLTSEKPTISIC